MPWTPPNKPQTPLTKSWAPPHKFLAPQNQDFFYPLNCPERIELLQPSLKHHQPIPWLPPSKSQTQPTESKTSPTKSRSCLRAVSWSPPNKSLASTNFALVQPYLETLPNLCNEFVRSCHDLFNPSLELLQTLSLTPQTKSRAPPTRSWTPPTNPQIIQPSLELPQLSLKLLQPSLELPQQSWAFSTKFWNAPAKLKILCRQCTMHMLFLVYCTICTACMCMYVHVVTVRWQYCPSPLLNPALHPNALFVPLNSLPFVTPLPPILSPSPPQAKSWSLVPVYCTVPCAGR
jgi:hypothetical protein